MPRKKPFSDEVFYAWEALTTTFAPDLPMDERWRGWEALFSRTYKDGRWVVEIGDAELVATLGHSICMDRGDFEHARDVLRLLLTHPSAPDGIGAIEWVVVGEAFADVLCGNIDRGLSQLRGEIHHRTRGKFYVRSALSYLSFLFHREGMDARPDPRIVKFTSECVARFRGRKRVAEKALEAETNQDLADALSTTWGR